METVFFEKHFSPFDILVKNFFNAEEQFQTPTSKIINHPVDIYEDEDGLHFDVACTGLTKDLIDIKVEDDILIVLYKKEDLPKCEGLHFYHSGIAKRSFNLGWKIARRFAISEINASMKDGLLKLLSRLRLKASQKQFQSNKIISCLQPKPEVF